MIFSRVVNSRLDMGPRFACPSAGGFGIPGFAVLPIGCVILVQAGHLQEEGTSDFQGHWHVCVKTSDMVQSNSLMRTEDVLSDLNSSSTAEYCRTGSFTENNCTCL